MKNNILYILMILLFYSINGISQTNDANIRFAILGGVNYQNLSGKNFIGGDLNTEALIGFHVGVNAQIKLANEFYFQPGLLYTTKGAKVTEAQVTDSYKLSYIELPLNLVYKATLGNGAFMLGFGPYVAYGINGSAQRDSGSGFIDSALEFTNIIETTDPLTTSYFKPLDAGANIFAGYEMSSGIFLQLNTQLGLLNIYPEDKRFTGDNTAIKHAGFGLSLGYRF